MKNLRPLLFFVSLLVIVGMACSVFTGGDRPTEAPPPTKQPVNNEPTEAPATEAPATETPEPTEPPTPEAQQFFTEEFDEPLSDVWSSRLFYDDKLSNPDKVKVEADDGKLVWDFDSKYVYYYVFYGAYEYEDVVVETISNNRGKNNNNVSLICRYDPEVGWYEFNIANNGLYSILFAKILDNGQVEWNRIANGGSKAIKSGLETNQYYAKCEGNELTLKINGADVISIKDKKYGELSNGLVGVSVSSFNVLPVRIEMDWLKISEP
ncbi:MAG TPA: hypothetical protein VHP14_07190 [Anaerolineales bacterium]|nr:hypothetical protein [Anaerolineales bacterium]